jgi:hypothetical protein
MEVSFRSDAAPKKIALVLTALGVALFYWVFRSCSLDEWDSVLFAMGVEKFDLLQHRPHPPGYPLYLFLGWVGHRLGMSIQGALLAVSAVSGGIYIATWLAIFRQALGKGMAVPLTVALAGMIGVWLTAGKVLTDMPSSAFLALEIWFCLQAKERRNALLWAGLCGAAAAGFRPQNFGIALLLVIVARWLAGRSGKEVAAAAGVLAAGCLAWLIPMMVVQAQAAGGDFFSYFDRVHDQWVSRYKNPNTFIGAGDGSAGFLLTRFGKHFGWSWFYLGFGLDPRTVAGIAGLVLVVVGAGFFFWNLKKNRTVFPAGFWAWQLVWAVPYVLTIFICLPADPRYYVPIYPLLLISVMVGLDRVPRLGRWMAWGFCAVLWWIAVPLAWQMHTEPPPTVRAMEWLRTQYPPEERGKVWVWLNDTHRHAVWFAPEFQNHSILEKARPGPEVIAVYSELPKLPRHLDEGGAYQEVARFSRPRRIHRKHETVILYRKEPGSQSPTDP